MLYTNNMCAIRTGLYAKAAYNALAGVLGQLSDGWGENNSKNDSWWQAAEVRRDPTGEAVIIVSENNYICGNSGPKNNFVEMPDDKVKAKFAYWIKKTAKMEHADMNAGDQWKPDSRFQHRYFEGDVTTAQAFAICAHLTNDAVEIRKATVDVVGQPKSPDLNAELAKVKAQYDAHLAKIDELAAVEKAELERRIKVWKDEAFAAWQERIAETKAACGAV